MMLSLLRQKIAFSLAIKSSKSKRGKGIRRTSQKHPQPSHRQIQQISKYQIWQRDSLFSLRHSILMFMMYDLVIAGNHSILSPSNRIRGFGKKKKRRIFKEKKSLKHWVKWLVGLLLCFIILLLPYVCAGRKRTHTETETVCQDWLVRAWEPVLVTKKCCTKKKKKKH